MRQLPLTDPGRPDLRSPGRFLLRVARLQWRSLIAGSVFGVVWMVGQALVPYVLGRAVDDGVAGADTSALLRWAGVLFAVGAIQAVAGVIRHRFAVFNWLVAAYRVQQWIVRHAVRLGGSLPQRIPTGEVVSVGATDIMQVGAAMEIEARLAGAVASFVVVAVIMLTSSTTLGLVVLIGVPALTLLIGPILRPLQRRQAAQRGAVGELTTFGSDTVAGLRVLRGIGGEETFVARYRRESQRVRGAGVEVARVESVLDAVQVLLPGIFVVAVTWLGARFSIAGRITAGDLVAFYGYAAFLITPLRTATEAADKISRGLVGAGRASRVLALEPMLPDADVAAPAPAAAAELVDSRSGLTIRPGELLAVVSGIPDDSSALADRLGRYVDADVTLDGRPLRDLPIADVRTRILVSDKDPRLFTGTLRDELDPLGRHADGTIMQALRAADAHDVLDGLSGGLDAAIEERGRSLSGGQRQRLVLARALLADPDVLVLDEPTSAVDAHTEARIADRLRAARAGRTTVVMTTSPLVLDRVDRVVLLDDGRVIADGDHHDLLRRSRAYRGVVTRSELAPGAAAGPASPLEMKEGA